MRKLDRTKVPAPPCLNEYDKGQNWNQIKPEHKQQIRDALTLMQGRHCAYCERLRKDEEIEHFRPKNRFPQLTFEWSNLFLACKFEDSCGKHKDHAVRNYSPDDLIDPCIDDPDEFLKFYSDGHVQPVRGASPEKEHRAKETIRVFNLNSPSLVNARRNFLRQYADRTAFESLSDEDYEAMLLDIYQKEPFPTALRQWLHSLAPPEL